jgi:hypothetical protein
LSPAVPQRSIRASPAMRHDVKAGTHDPDEASWPGPDQEERW